METVANSSPRLLPHVGTCADSATRSGYSEIFALALSRGRHSIYGPAHALLADIPSTRLLAPARCRIRPLRVLPRNEVRRRPRKQGESRRRTCDRSDIEGGICREFINLPNPYQGMYVMDRELAEFHFRYSVFRSSLLSETHFWGVRGGASRGTHLRPHSYGSAVSKCCSYSSRWQAGPFTRRASLNT